MRQIATVCGAFALCLAVAACGGGDSDNSLSTGIGGGTNNVGPSGTATSLGPTPTVARQDGAGTGMTDQQLAFASEVFELVNAYRTGNGRSALTWEARIAAVAQNHNLYMRDTAGQLTHAGPGTCTVPSVCLANRLMTGTVPYVSAGENLAHRGFTAQQVVDAWIASPQHNDNLLDPSWTHIGIGMLTGASPVNSNLTGPWWTQVFVQR